MVWRVLPPKLLGTKKPWVYGVDSKWLRREGAVIIHWDVINQQNLYWSYHPSESYLAYAADLDRLTVLLKDRFPSGAISDWQGAIVANLARYLNQIPHQRCLAHAVRLAKSLLPKKSLFKATRVLRRIGQQLINIRTETDRANWLALLINWEKRFGWMLKQKTLAGNTGSQETRKGKKQWWYTHGNLRRGWRLLTKDWQPFFVHLEYPLIPSSNNSLEGTISQAKAKLTNHRGMKTRQQVSFLFWYLTLTRVKTRPDLKKLWDEWKKTKN